MVQSWFLKDDASHLFCACAEFCKILCQSEYTKRRFTALLTFKQQRKSEVSRRPSLRHMTHIGDGSEGDRGGGGGGGGRAQVSATGAQRTIIIMHTGATRASVSDARSRSCRQYDCNYMVPTPQIYCFLHKCTYSLYHLILLRAVLLRMCILLF